MIEVICVPTGDRGWAEDPEAALTAARQLRRDARDAGVGEPHPTVLFLMDGKLIREVRYAL